MKEHKSSKIIDNCQLCLRNECILCKFVVLFMSKNIFKVCKLAYQLTSMCPPKIDPAVSPR